MSEQKQVFTGYVVLIAAAAAIGGFLFGFDTAVINGAVLALKEQFHAGDWGISTSVSLALLAAAAGAFFAGAVADRFGRIRCMVAASFLFFISAIGSGIPFTIWDFIFWRVVGGLGVGAASVIAPAYIAETAPAFLRGRLGSLQQLAVVLGIFAALVSNWAIVSFSGGAMEPWLFGLASWRWMFWMEAIPAAIYGVAALCIPESPRYLVAKDRPEEAKSILARLGDQNPIRRVKEIVHSLAGEIRGGFRDLLATSGERGWLKKIVWAGLGLAILQQLVGINVIFYYGNVLWQSVGFSEADSLKLNVFTSIVNVLTTLVAIASVDRFGRKPLLLIGSVGMFLTLSTMAAVFGMSPLDAATGHPALGVKAGWTALAAANLYIVFFGMSWGPVMWVMLGEMFPNRLRASALAVCGLAQWVANYLVSQTFMPLMSGLGLSGAYGLYAAFAFVSIFFVAFSLRETKNMELEDM